MRVRREGSTHSEPSPGGPAMAGQCACELSRESPEERCCPDARGASTAFRGPHCTGPTPSDMEGRRSQTSPALPARRAVSTAGFPGAAEGRRARSAGREGGRERASRDGQLWNPGRAPTWPSRLGSHSSVIPGPRAREAAARRRRASPGALPFPVLEFSFPSLTSFPPNLPRTGVPPPTRRISLGARKSPAAAPSRHT